MHARIRSISVLLALLAVVVAGCRNENDTPPPPAPVAAPPAVRAPESGPPGEAAHTPPVVDMRGCMQITSAREKSDGKERAREDCPTKLHDETRRENRKNVTYSFTLNQARTDDVRVRAVANVCCYDKSPLLSSP
jgi:hypothetical protein